MSDLLMVVEPLTRERIPRHVAMALINLLIKQVDMLDRLPDQHHLRNQFVYRLLFERAHDPHSEASLLRQGQMLGIDLTLPRTAILIDAAEYISRPQDASGEVPRRAPSELDEARMQRHVQQIINAIVAFFHLPSDTICAYVGDGEIVVLKASSTNDLLAWTEQDDLSEPPTAAHLPHIHMQHTRPSGASWANLAALKRASTALLDHIRRETGAEIHIGIGRYHPGICGLSRSYQDARTALLLGRHFHPNNQLYCLDELGIAAFIGIADERTKVDLAWHLLGPLDDEAELLETLNVFFATDCSSSIAASQLAVHRNTLTYRLDKVTQLTGLDPRRFDQAVQIRLALLLRSL